MNAFTLHEKRRLAEKEVDSALHELETKGFTWSRASTYQALQSAWWKACDEYDKTLSNSNRTY